MIVCPNCKTSIITIDVPQSTIYARFTVDNNVLIRCSNGLPYQDLINVFHKPDAAPARCQKCGMTFFVETKKLQ